MKRLMVSAVFGALLVASSVAGAAEAERPPARNWSWQGIFGTFDRAALQRGLQVYKEVCSGCHGLRFVAYRNLVDLGYTPEQVKAFAAQFEVEDGPNDEGEMYMRPARPADRFVSPFPNEQAARAANHGASPPDLSLIVEARENGADYVYALLTGYGDPPEGVQVREGMNYNKYFPGHQIAMPPPLSEDAVEYQDGTKATVDQMARDVVAFLAWAAEPNMEARKATGLKVMLFLFVLTGMLIAVKKKVWSDVH